MEPSSTRDLAHALNSTTTIPSDLIFEILSFLPAKSLIRFQYVLKLWFSIIRSKNFVDSFMAMSKTRPRLLLHLMHHQTRERFIFSTPEHNNYDDNSSSRVIARHDMTISDPVSHIKYFHLEGLICCISGSSITVCNPATRQIVKLPDVTPNGRHMQLHIGYDPVENQYKVLCMMRFNQRRARHHQSIQQEHLICTVRSSPKQEWRKIENITGDSYPIYGGVCINGAKYYGIGPSRIVRFDVRSEKMVQIIKAPEQSFDFPFINYKGKLAGVGYIYYRLLRLWILENAEKHEWSSMMCALPFEFDIYEPQRVYYKRVILSGELMVFHQWVGASKRFYVSYYDFNKLRLRGVEIQGVADGDGDDGELKGPMLCYPGYVENIRFL